MKESYAAQPKDIEIFLVGSQTDVIIRQNIESVTEESEDGTTYETWQCDEVQFRYDGILTRSEIEPQIDKWVSYANRTSIDALTLAKEKTIAAMSQICNATIRAGFSVELSDGERHHFSLEMTDQLMISRLAAKVAAGASTVAWHADGEDCQFFFAADIERINAMMESLIDYHTVYFNSLRRWIRSVETMEELSTINYGDSIPAEFQSEVLHWILGD